MKTDAPGCRASATFLSPVVVLEGSFHQEMLGEGEFFSECFALLGVEVVE